MTTPDFKIAAIQKFSTLDYPGKLSAVVFSQGCPIRCVYCHNPDFQDYTKPGIIAFTDLLNFIKERKGLLDAIVFSGGEPLMQRDLYDAISIVKQEGFLLGLHTAGTIPNKLNQVLPLLDWVGFDIKTSFDKYEEITRIPNSGKLALEGFDLLQKSGIPYEVRTTVDSRNIKSEDLIDIAKFLKLKNVKKWVLQECIIRSAEKNLNIPLPNQDIIANISKYTEVEIRRQ